MSDKIHTGGPAFPTQYSNESDGPTVMPSEGMTLREYAAIKLQVPNSGTDWLDEMICESLRNSFAEKAMQGMWASDTETWRCNFTQEGLDSRARYSYKMADAMLKARKEPEK